MAEPVFNFDLERMQRVVEAPTIKIPRGLAGAKQLKQYLRDHLKNPTVDYTAAEITRGLIL